MARTTSQRDHARKFAKAEAEIDACVARIARAVTSLRHWQKRARYHGREMHITDEQRVARAAEQRARREAKKRHERTRAIRLED